MLDHYTLYNIFESAELKVMVVNAQHMKAVPGRKTDAKDAEWIADLLLHGLLKASYIPDWNHRELRGIGFLQKKPGAGKEPGIELTAKNAERCKCKVIGNDFKH